MLLFVLKCQSTEKRKYTAADRAELCFICRQFNQCAANVRGLDISKGWPSFEEIKLHVLIC